MKRYPLFAGPDYYPRGGWDDFAGEFDGREAARAAVARREGEGWWHVVDTNFRTIAEGGYFYRGDVSIA